MHGFHPVHGIAKLQLAFIISRRRVLVPWDASVTACVLQSDWNIVKRGYDAAVLGEAPHKFKDPVEAIKTLRVSPEAAPKIHGSSAVCLRLLLCPCILAGYEQPSRASELLLLQPTGTKGEGWQGSLRPAAAAFCDHR